MAEAVIILFQDDGTVTVGRSEIMGCFQKAPFQHSLWRPSDEFVMEKVREELTKVKRIKR